MSRIFKHVNLFHRGTVGDGVVTAFSCRGYLYTSLRQERRGALHEPTSVDVASRSCEVRSLSQIVYGGHFETLWCCLAANGSHSGSGRRLSWQMCLRVHIFRSEPYWELVQQGA